MIDFEEEIERFKPSLDVEEVEDAIVKSDLTDMTDIMMELIKRKRRAGPVNTDYARKNQQIANSFYNLGLEKARIRDLSGAAQCLKKSLHFNKYQTDARNLLGLIYYENGEVADALVQWVISLNLQPEDNLADHYLDEIQRKPGQLEIESQNVKTFNQALWHAQNGSDDLAILQLARVVESNPHFVKAHLLPGPVIYG